MTAAVHVHDRELLTRTRAGDGEAFAAFYRARRGDVLAFLRVRVRSSELAADLMCETFARALVRLFAHAGLVPRLATVAGPQGVTYDPPLPERLYERGCVRADLASPGNDNRFVDVLLNAHTAPRLRSDRVYPPASWFRP